MKDATLELTISGEAYEVLEAQASEHGRGVTEQMKDVLEAWALEHATETEDE